MATVYYTAATLDGFLATTDNSLAWLFEVPGAAAAESTIGDFVAGVGALAMGATTYRWLLEHEQLLREPDKWREWYGDRPTRVFSHHALPRVPGAPIAVVQGPVADVHTDLVAAAGERDVWLLGGGDLVGQFADAGLLDRIVVTIAPVTLGAGAPLLPRALRADRLRLTAVRRRGQFAEVAYAVGAPGAAE